MQYLHQLNPLPNFSLFLCMCVCVCVCSVDDEEHQYRLHVSGFSGTVQDSFGWYHDKQGFSTPDSGNICAEISHGGWWYNQCFYANLNGVYYRVSVHRESKCLLSKTSHFHSATSQRPICTLTAVKFIIHIKATQMLMEKVQI